MEEDSTYQKEIDVYNDDGDEVMSEEEELEDRNEEDEIFGLTNYGNTCYANSALQCLLNCKDLIEIIKSKLLDELLIIYLKENKKIKNEIELFYFFKQFINNYYHDENTLQDLLNSFYKSFPYLYDYYFNEQQDAVEFLQLIIDSIHEAIIELIKFSKIHNLKDNYNLNLNNLIINLENGLNDLFQIEQITNVTCEECKKSSITKQYCFYFSTSIPKLENNNNNNTGFLKSSYHYISSFFYTNNNNTTTKNNCEISLQDCFTKYFEKEYLINENKYQCDFCKNYRNAEKFNLLKKLPNTLIIHFKRFEQIFSQQQSSFWNFLFSDNGIYKKKDFINFPLNFNINNYLNHFLEKDFAHDNFFNNNNNNTFNNNNNNKLSTSTSTTTLNSSDGSSGNNSESGISVNNNTTSSESGSIGGNANANANNNNNGDIIANANGMSANYELTSIICHHGSSISYGHYTCFIKRNNCWYHCNDETICKVDCSNDENNYEQKFNKIEAYCLFYTKK
ncbi:hypothetical protein ABK040_005605 [Willaertia magna]